MIIIPSPPLIRVTSVTRNYEKVIPIRSVLKERGSQPEGSFTNLNLNTAKKPDPAIQLVQFFSSKQEKASLNQRRARAIEDLENIFRIKRQNNSTSDLHSHGSMQQIRLSQSINRVSVEVNDKFTCR